MKILVAIKQIPRRDATPQIDESGRWNPDEQSEFETNEPDAFALEEALQLKDRHGGEVVVLSAGPERVAQSIREALSLGADRGIHIVCDDLAGLDTLGLAGRLAEAARRESPDLILTGLQSDDLGLGQTGVVMAELLDIPHATIIMQVEAGDGRVRVKRELESGWFQWIELPLPALLTIQSGIAKLRYASLMGIKKARTKEIRKIAAAELGPPPAPSVTLHRVFPPQSRKSTQIIGGPPAEAAAKLVEKLRSEVRAI
jgi:electron transfer flavoprotein beta subunit